MTEVPNPFSPPKTDNVLKSQLPPTGLEKLNRLKNKIPTPPQEITEARVQAMDTLKNLGAPSTAELSTAELFEKMKGVKNNPKELEQVLNKYK